MGEKANPSLDEQGNEPNSQAHAEQDQPGKLCEWDKVSCEDAQECGKRQPEKGHELGEVDGVINGRRGGRRWRRCGLGSHGVILA
jgi:hypothetical protein